MAHIDIEDVDEFLEFIDEGEGMLENDRLPKRYIRDAENPLEAFRDNEFRCRYRFSKECVTYIILPIVENNLLKTDRRGLPILPIFQLLLFLRFIATGNFQVVSGDLRGISQATVSLIIKRVSICLAQQTANFIKFPIQDAEQQENITKFYQIARFPGVGACIDCTHIPIVNPGGDNAEVFRNRKGYFSLNVQVAAGPHMEILDIVVRHPGSTHDSVIFDRSALRVRFEQRQIQGFLLGDNGYPCRNYLLTPVIQPGNPNEISYNTSHIRTRNIVERVFGVWKRRFPCLRRTLSTKLETSLSIICACAVLYNIGLQQDNINFDNEFIDEDLPRELPAVNNADNNELGLIYRHNFIHQHF